MTVGISYINFNTGPFGGVRSIMQVPIISPIFRPSPAVMVFDACTLAQGSLGVLVSVYIWCPIWGGPPPLNS